MEANKRFYKNTHICGSQQKVLQKHQYLWKPTKCSTKTPIFVEGKPKVLQKHQCLWKANKKFYKNTNICGGKPLWRLPVCFDGGHPRCGVCLCASMGSPTPMRSDRSRWPATIPAGMLRQVSKPCQRPALDQRLDQGARPPSRPRIKRSSGRLLNSSSTDV